jgi:hypothetical protein
MRNNKKTNKGEILFIIISSLLVFTSLFSLAFADMNKSSDGGKSLNKVNLKAGDAYRMFINNIDLPLDKQGIIANVNIGGRAGGELDGKVFLFSGGFYLTGKDGNSVWGNAVASASRIQDYQCGTIKDGKNDPRAQLYVVSKSDGDFAQSWIEWKDAVDLGADFYDGDKDGVYDPVDKNQNGVWDKDEDRPDLVGDQTVWCVYNDGINTALRQWPGQVPKGIEIRQSVFAFASAGLLGNIVFVRYNIVNTGTVSAVLDSVLFSVWADPDLGDPYDDLVGCDTLLNAGFLYNEGADVNFGPNPPCFLIDFFQGPIAYIPGKSFTDNNNNGVYDAGDIPLDTAYNVRGLVMGVDTIIGASNLGLSSFVHYQQSDPLLGDPAFVPEARNYQFGKDRKGKIPDPCTWTLGTVAGGVTCANVDPRFWYSGNPVTNVGWINTSPTDQRLMLNTGPFRLEAGKPVTVVAAYVVGRGSDAINSITIAKKIDNFAQFIYDNNFKAPPTPPAVQPVVSTSDDFIDIEWDTEKQVNFKDSTIAWNIKFEGFNVYEYKTNTTADIVNFQPNSGVIARYDINNFIQDVYKEDAQTHAITLKYPTSTDENSLDKKIYADPTTGKIRLRLTTDPLTGGPLIKGKQYYFAITSYGLNRDALINKAGGAFGTVGNYYISGAAFTGEVENIPQIFIVTVGENKFQPPIEEITGTREGPSNGEVTFDVVDKEALTGDTYSVKFFVDSSAASYNPFWKLINDRTGVTLIDSCNQYLFGKTSIASNLERDGFIPRIKEIKATIGTVKYSSSGDPTISDLSVDRGTGAYYVGTDIDQGRKYPIEKELPGLSGIQSSYIKADQLRKVELRFGENGKAYRYLNGFVGNAITRASSYTYAVGVIATDTTGKGPVGNLGNGFVDVPFTAWVVDSAFGEQKQLAVGFIERAKNFQKGISGNPDGVWDPDTSLKQSVELIMIFNAPFDPNGQQIEYTGGVFDSKAAWADLKGYVLPAESQTSSTQKKIAKSGFFNSLYVVGVEKKLDANIGATKSKITVPISVYPYTTKDVYKFVSTPQGSLTQNEKKEIFNKVNVFPNPLFAFNAATSYNNGNPDEPFVTFSNLPEEITIKIYTLSGVLIRTLTTQDKSSPTSPFLRWNLQNESDLRVASGMYLAIVSSPGYGTKILKFAIIMPQKQIQRF